MIEKDWWVTTTLEALFTCDLHIAFAFKGGTSLSKCWHLLHRFSEDIDIVMDKSLFGIHDDVYLGNHQNKKLRRTAHQFVMDTVAPMLQARLIAMGIPRDCFQLYPEQSKCSDQDPTVLLLDYTSHTTIHNAYTRHQIKIEIGVRAMMEPCEQQPICSLLAQHLHINEIIPINTVLPQRTFWEKSILLHELFQKPLDKMDIARMSRHWYDLHYLVQGGFAQEAMQTATLFNAIRLHRKIFSRVAGVDYDQLSARTLHLFPPVEKESAWRLDYKKMMESYIYRDAPSPEALQATMLALCADFKQLDF